MAKRSKSRKKRKTKQTARRPQMRPMAAATTTRTESGDSRAAVTRRRGAVSTPKVDFAQEYKYVYTDLKRVGVIAAAMLVILVALSFVIA